jgi:hypothetical protein
MKNKVVTTTRPFMRWADTGEGVLKVRNSSDTEWIIIGELGGVEDEVFIAWYSKECPKNKQIEKQKGEIK